MGMGTGARAIQSGTTADGAYPAVAALRYTGTFSGTPVDKVACTGTLIAPDTILTAAHCIDRSITDQVGLPMVSFADDSTVPGTATWLPVRDVLAHEGYVHGTVFHIYFESPHDVALVFLAEPVTGITPMELGTDLVTTGTAVVQVGFGQRTLNDDTTLGLKYQTTMSVTDMGATEIRFLGSGCAGFGDSGGPTIADGRVVGVFSHGGGEMLTCDQGDISERVDVYAGWITAHIPVAEEEPPPDDGGCSASGSPSPWLAVLLAGLVRWRRGYRS